MNHVLLLAFLSTCLMLADPISAQDGKTKAAPAPASALITKDSVGAVRIGMMVAQARKAMPKSKFERTTDGDGLALIEVKSGETLEMEIYAGEEDPDRPINDRAKIKMIRIFGPAFKTAQGVHTGMRLREVEKIYGKLVSITMSEIESREYAEFTSSPPGLLFRVGLPEIGIAGQYPEGKRETKNYLPSAVISIIEIYGH